MTVEEFDAAINAAADRMIEAARAFQKEIDALQAASTEAGIADHIVVACLTAVQSKIEAAAS